MDKLGKVMKKLAQKNTFWQVFANLFVCFSLSLHLCWDVLLTFKDFEYISAGAMAQLEKHIAVSQDFLNGLTELPKYGKWILCR